MLVLRENVQTTEDISILRGQIDEIDEQLLTLLSKRMRISKEIGTFKKEHNMPVLQSGRYNEILEKREKMGAAMNLSGEFVNAIMKSIHEESVRVQLLL
jgi:chorismate mutase